MKKPYIKKFSKIANFNVWIVDGEYIRENLDEEFTNFGQHYRFSFIPKNEFWIDKENDEGEGKYFIDHLLTENRLMSEGKSYHTAIMKADAIEKRERGNSTIFRAVQKKKFEKKKILEEIHKKLLKKFSNKKIKMWIVDGELVRDMFFIDFTEGGNDKIYDFIPDGEIWVDDDTSPKERKFILLHELHERNLMAKGMGYAPEYLTKKWNKTPVHESAHKSASEIEYYCRKHPKELDKKIREEIRKASKE